MGTFRCDTDRQIKLFEKGENLARKIYLSLPLDAATVPSSNAAILLLLCLCCCSHCVYERVCVGLGLVAVFHCSLCLVWQSTCLGRDD